MREKFMVFSFFLTTCIFVFVDRLQAEQDFATVLENSQQAIEKHLPAVKKLQDDALAGSLKWQRETENISKSGRLKTEQHLAEVDKLKAASDAKAKKFHGDIRQLARMSQQKTGEYLADAEELKQAAQTKAKEYQEQVSQFLDGGCKGKSCKKGSPVIETGQLAIKDQQGVAKYNHMCLKKINKNYLKSKAKVLVFVSFSMNARTLRILLADAKKLGAKVLLRGLYKNSFLETAKKVQALGGSLDIDPEQFNKYQIKLVPSFVVTRDNKSFDKLAGNISLCKALEIFIAKGEVLKGKA